MRTINHRILMCLLIASAPATVAADSPRPVKPTDGLSSPAVAEHRGIYVGLWRRFGTAANFDGRPTLPDAVSSTHESPGTATTNDAAAAPLWPVTGDLSGLAASDLIPDEPLLPMERVDTASGISERSDWQRAAVRDPGSATESATHRVPGATTLVVGLVAVIVMLGLLLMPR